MTSEEKDEKRANLTQWVSSLYETAFISNEELNQWYEEYRYHGFNRNEVLTELMEKVPDIKISSQIVLICALNGPQRAAETKLIGGRRIKDYGIDASGKKREKGISCQRVMAATADLAATLLKRLKVPKRLNLPCPAWLQFPSAGSITMPKHLREQHLEFSRRFSTVIGGVFNEAIYSQMVSNSYLDQNLKEALFGNDELEKSQIEVLIPAPAPIGAMDMNPPSGEALPNPLLSQASGQGRVKPR